MGGPTGLHCFIMFMYYNSTWSAFASRCLQGKLLQLIFEVLNKGAVPGARLQSFLISGEKGRDSVGERHAASRAVSESQEADVTHVACPPAKNSSWALLFMRKHQNSFVLTSWASSDSTPPWSASINRPSPVSYLPYFITLQGFGICCSLCPEDGSLCSFPRKGILTLQISTLTYLFL